MTSEAARAGTKDWIAALPMYDFPEVADAHDRLWAGLRRHLIDVGIAQPPRRLTRGMHHEEVWQHRSLLLGQACEYPLAKKYAQQVRLVATPRYEVPGCAGSAYRSVILVRGSDRAQTLMDLKGSRCVINDPASNSGMNLFRASIAPYANGERFFHSVRLSGSHRESVRTLASGEADVSAVDCVSWAHLQQIDQPAAAQLRVIGWSAPTPSLPFVTAASSTDDLLVRLRSALSALTEDLESRAAREALFLKDFDLNPRTEFAEVLELERVASRWGYAELS
jgi:ABC-type phosphate/phosphonate transport system substrate-binding protein